MPLELRKTRTGAFRRVWYGRYEVSGKRYCLNLGVKVQGTPPISGSLRDLGDAIFERSRAQAQVRLDSLVAEARSRKDAVHLVEKIYEIKTGESMQAPSIDSLADEWARIPRRRQPYAAYLNGCRSIFERFATYVKRHCPGNPDVGQVTRAIARGFLDTESNRNISPRTWNNSLTLLRSAMKHLLPAGFVNPFDGIPTRELDTIFRAPFSPEDLAAIIEAAREDDFIRPIIVTGMCTAMRRGDCCRLRWRDVDIDNRFITVKTSKTGQTVSIPIFPLLHNELSTRPHKGEYVFPEQAEMYRTNPDGITHRVRKVLKRAGFVKSKTARHIADGGEDDAHPLPVLPPDELRAKATAAIETSGITRPKQRRMLDILDAYLDGKSMKETADELGCGKGTVSCHLNQIEQMIAAAVVRRAEKEPLPTVVRGTVDAARPNGQRRASIRDFHSFRVTWVTLALTAGVPIELVTRVTGHRTTDVVLKHYFQPGREDFRRALQSAMPDLLTCGNEKSPIDEMKEILESTSEKTWRQDVERLRQLHCRMTEPIREYTLT